MTISISFSPEENGIVGDNKSTIPRSKLKGAKTLMLSIAQKCKPFPIHTKRSIAFEIPPANVEILNISLEIPIVGFVNSVTIFQEIPSKTSTLAVSGLVPVNL